MNIIREKYKAVRESLGISRILSTYTLASMVTFPEGDRFQININTYLRCLVSPNNPVGNVLILQGGVKHMNSNGYYVKTACSLLSKKLRVFIFEKLLPVNNSEFAHDVAGCLDFIRTEFPGPTCVIGYSMGGILLYSYLSMGYDQADLYIPTCCPIDLDQFEKAISSHALFKIIQNRAYRSYQVNGYEELLEFSGTSLEKNREFEKAFIQNLNNTSHKWTYKTIYILASDDPVTSPDDLKLLNNPPLTYWVKGGWHCCLDSICLSAALVNRYIEGYNEGLYYSPDEIPVNIFLNDIIGN